MISNRRVYFISGFDPRGAGFYHRLYREESKKQTRLNAAEIESGKRKRNNALFNSWEINAQWGLHTVKTDYRFLCWDDIVRKNWTDSLGALIAKSAGMYLWHIQTGLLKKFKAAGNGPFICSILPLAFVLGSLLAASIFALATGLLLHSLLGNVFITSIGATSSFIGLVLWAKPLGEKLNVWWILQSYFFQSTWGKNGNPDLENRLALFAQQIIADGQESPVDEILLIGHCTGTLLAVSTLANIIKQDHRTLVGKLKLVTLGQSIPYVSYQTTAIKSRQDLTSVIENNEFPWFDFGARADPLCFEQVDPAFAHGMMINNRYWPSRHIVRPYQMFSPQTYHLLKKNKLRIHFQYLMSSDLATEYDYFQITTSPEALEIASSASKKH